MTWHGTVGGKQWFNNSWLVKKEEKKNKTYGECAVPLGQKC